jgi:hypothetical protein
VQAQTLRGGVRACLRDLKRLLCYGRGPRGAPTLFTQLGSPTTRHLSKVLGHYAPSTVFCAACGVPDCKIYQAQAASPRGLWT